MDLPSIHSSYLAGTSLVALAAANNLTKHRLYALLCDSNYPMRSCGAVKGTPRNKLSKETESAVRNDFTVLRLPKLQIAEKHGISTTAINRIIGGGKPRNKLRYSASRFRPDTQEARCIDCSCWKPIDQFYVDRACSYGRMSVCKDCQLARNRKKLYKLDPAQYSAMLSEQGGVCAICGALPTDKSNRGHSVLSVDHDHVSLSVRKLLCARCNHVLGLMEDMPTLLRAAADYLDRHGSGLTLK